MPERESFMKLRSSIAAKYAGVAMVMCLMPVVPVVAGSGSRKNYL